MPIKPELRYYYPIDWPQISRWVRFVRAKGCCEACGRPHGQVVRHLGDGRWWDEARQTWRDGRGRKIPCPGRTRSRLGQPRWCWRQHISTTTPGTAADDNRNVKPRPSGRVLGRIEPARQPHPVPLLRVPPEPFDSKRLAGMTDAAPPISRYPVPALDAMPEDIRARILKVQEKSGFIPNVFLMLAYRPDEFRAFMAYHDALMDKEGGLTKAEREMIVVVVSAANQCQYCVVAHGAILRIRARNPLIADQVAANYRKADITPRQRAMLDFAMKVARQAETVDETDSVVLRGLGFSDDDVWDIAAIAAFFGMSNRLANFASLRPNDEFYALGRS